MRGKKSHDQEAEEGLLEVERRSPYGEEEDEEMEEVEKTLLQLLLQR